jgi:hypothetical protein
VPLPDPPAAPPAGPPDADGRPLTVGARVVVVDTVIAVKYIESLLGMTGTVVSLTGKGLYGDCVTVRWDPETNGNGFHDGGWLAQRFRQLAPPTPPTQPTVADILSGRRSL